MKCSRCKADYNLTYTKVIINGCEELELCPLCMQSFDGWLASPNSRTLYQYLTRLESMAESLQEGIRNAKAGDYR